MIDSKIGFLICNCFILERAIVQLLLAILLTNTCKTGFLNILERILSFSNEKFSRHIIIVLVIGLQFDAEKAMKQNLPIDNIEFYAGEQDSDIHCALSIVIALEIKKPLLLQGILNKSLKR